MLRFLVSRPIAVLLSTFGLVVLGLIVLRTLPISLLPEVPIPQVTVQVSYANIAARELENTVTRPLRQQLMQVGQLKDIGSSTRNGAATITLEFEHGTNTNLAFIEVNEKVDQAMGALPNDLPRPRVLKANVTDIPVFHLSIFEKGNSEIADKSPQQISANNKSSVSLELTELARNTLRRRIEQLPEVAFVDMSGFAEPEVVILPKNEVFQSLGLSENQLADILRSNDLDLGSILVRDGHYQYHIRFRSSLRSVSDLEDVWFRHAGQVLRLKDVADISLRPKQQRGMFLHDGEPAIVFSVRKKANAQLFAMKQSFAELLGQMKADFPQLGFSVSNDQSELLEVSVDNLRTSLLYGAFFAFAVLFLFFREWLSPLLIGIIIPVSLIIALFGFYLSGTTINIISISGLILGVGLMIDNGIIVMENVRQYRRMGHAKTDAAVMGANEVIRPLISSALTTCSVFVPLVFLSGIGGALFADQALSVTLALGASLVVAYILLPTLLNLGKKNSQGIDEKLKNEKAGENRFYKKTSHWALRYKWLVALLFLSPVIAIWFLLPNLMTESFPPLTRQGLAVQVDWVGPLALEEGAARLSRLFKVLGDDCHSTDLFLGEQQFLLTNEEQAMNEATLWLFGDPEVLAEKVNLFFQNTYPQANARVRPLKTVFDEIFTSDHPPLTAHLQLIDGQETPPHSVVRPVLDDVIKQGMPAQMPPQQEQVEVSILHDLALQYNVPFESIYAKLQSLFSQYQISTLRTSGQHVPIVVGVHEQGLYQLLENAFVKNADGMDLPLSRLVKTDRRLSPKAITAGKSGESLDLPLLSFSEKRMTSIRQSTARTGKLSVHFTGQAFEDQRSVWELAVILGVSLLLLYLILAAQFESLVQPLIVIFTVPVGAAGALFLLMLAGQSLNLVSIIGLIVMGGIVVNDAILKVDMMNRFSKEMPLEEAVHLAGLRRLKPIVMTSVTTILALLPVLFSGGLGAELQRPLAWAVIGGLTVGTVAGLYFVPVLYALVRRT